MKVRQQAGIHLKVAMALVLIGGSMAETAKSLALTGTKSGQPRGIVTYAMTRSSVVAKLQFLQGGKPIAGASVTWRTDDNSASGGPKTTDASGKVSFSALTGSVVVSLRPECDPIDGAQCGVFVASRVGSVEWTTSFTGSVQPFSIDERPPVATMTVKVVLPNGEPVRGAAVFDTVGVVYSNGRGFMCADVCTTPIASLTSGTSSTSWNGSLYWIDTTPRSCLPRVYGCDGAISNADGLATFRGFDFTGGADRGFTVIYDNGELHQRLTLIDVALDLTKSTASTLTLLYMPYLEVASDEVVVGEGDTAIINVTAKDDAGNPIPDKTLSIVGVSASSVRSISVTSSRVSGSCVENKSGKTDTAGRLAFKLCPAKAGVFYVKATGIVPSRNIKVYVGAKIAKGQWRSAAYLATKAGLTVPRGATVTVKVVDRYKANCSVIKNSLYTAKAGGCRFAVTVTPKTGKRSARYLAYRITS